MLLHSLSLHVAFQTQPAKNGNGMENDKGLKIWLRGKNEKKQRL